METAEAVRGLWTMGESTRNGSRIWEARGWLSLAGAPSPPIEEELVGTAPVTRPERNDVGLVGLTSWSTCQNTERRL